jgi:hypothetical protein
METHYDAYLAFPESSSSGYYTSEYYQQSFDRLVKLLGCVEAVEQAFDIEFSCGDGKYFSDFQEFPLDESEWRKYDGEVCLETPPRYGGDGHTLNKNKAYNFKVLYNPKTEEQVCYINDKVTSRQSIRV